MPVRCVERMILGDGRDWACGLARGRTLEVAVGSGRNLPRYGPDVALTAVDVDPRALRRAGARAAAAGVRVDLRVADAGHLPLPDGCVDTVVCTFGLCAVPDREAALAEMVRVLRPGGRLVLIDHAESRWRHGRPASLAAATGMVTTHRRRSRLGLIERYAARKP